MKIRNQKNKLGVILLVVLNVFGACTNEDQKQETSQNNNSESSTIFISRDVPSTKTSIAHTVGAVANVVSWISGDNIWVEDGGNLIASTTSNITTKTTDAKFQVPGSFTGTSYNIFYTGNNSTSGNTVTIKNEQTQSAPNNFDHAGVSGDCGVAVASKIGNNFAFSLNHKAAYLCFLPRSANDVIAGCKLTKIEVTSDDDIAGDYTLSPSGLSASPTANASKTITLKTGNGFNLDNSTTDITKNGAYMVITPGTHTLTIRYWVKSETDNVEAHITKYVQGTFAPNSMTDITAKLDNSYTNVKYYLWDAKKDLWDGLESTQPTKNGDSAPTGLKLDDGTPRNTFKRMPLHYQENNFIAVNSCANLPNRNEMKWYHSGGDWYADNYEAVVLMGHLYRGGLWCKKHNYIPGFSSTTAPASDPHTIVAKEGRPAYQDLNKYFYIPYLGSYRLNGVNKGDDMTATFGRGVGIYGFITWGRDIDAIYGSWYPDASGNYMPNDTYNPCSSTIYCAFTTNGLYDDIMNEKSLTYKSAIPIYKFE